MKKIVLILMILLSYKSFAQNCDRVFNTTLTYTNSELNLNYNNTSSSFNYKIFQRTNETVNTDCNVIDVKKPIIICEGFDIFNDISMDDIYQLYLNPNGYGDLLRNQGYDIIVYNLNTPQSALQPNALCFANFINFINENKKGNEENVVMGVSLGGVLARYALVYMENNNIPHNTRLFVSFDSPQQGANVPLSIQGFSFDTRGVAGVAGVFGQTDLIYLWQTLISQGSQQLISNYVTTIADGVSYPHPLHTNFFNELKSLNNSLGYPQNCKKIAICDGSYKADLQKPYNNSIWGKYSGNPAISFKLKLLGIDYEAWSLRTAPGVDNWVWDDFDCCVLSHWNDCDIKNSVGTSIYALKNNINPLDHASGGKYPWFQIINDILINMPEYFTVQSYNNDYACFIPTISALDLNTDDKQLNLSDYSKSNILLDSPFDDIWWDTTQVNLTHTVLTSNMGFWLYQQIISNTDNYSGATDKIISNTTIDKNAIYKSTNSISFSNVNILNSVNVIAKAGNEIVLKPGFSVPSGSVFNAKIEPFNLPKRTLTGNLPNFSLNRQTAQNVKKHEPGIESKNMVSDLPTEKVAKMSIYPTLAKEFLTIQLEDITFPVSIEIFNSYGQVTDLLSICNNVLQLNVSTYTSGLYFVKVKKDAKCIAISKFIKK